MSNRTSNTLSLETIEDNIIQYFGKTFSEPLFRSESKKRDLPDDYFLFMVSGVAQQNYRLGQTGTISFEVMVHAQSTTATKSRDMISSLNTQLNGAVGWFANLYATMIDVEIMPSAYDQSTTTFSTSCAIIIKMNNPPLIINDTNRGFEEITP